MEDIDDNELLTCNNCNSEVNADDSVISSSHERLCSDCCYICEHCDSIRNRDDGYNSVDDAIWCEGCTDDDATWCNYNRHQEWTQDSSYWISDIGESWCSGCADSRANWCESCEEYSAEGCDSCEGGDFVNGIKVVHDYTYRPDAIFHTTDNNTRLFFGMEIEVESPNGWEIRNESARYLYDKLEAGASLAYLKNDGSLNCGYEIVTHPMTYDFFTNEATEFWESLDHIRDVYNMKSWATKTCGLHIHISRTGFTNPPHLHRFLNLVYSNPDFYQAMAGRSASSWAKFDDVMSYNTETRVVGRSYKNKVADPSRTSTDRYSAVNTNNYATIEMRIFKGSINKTNVRGALGLAHASVEYTRTMSIQEVKDGALCASNLIKYIESKPELYADTIIRIGKARMTAVFN